MQSVCGVCGRTSVLFDILTEIEKAQEFEKKADSDGLVIG
jgi:hypothetical protein